MLTRQLRILCTLSHWLYKKMFSLPYLLSSFNLYSLSPHPSLPPLSPTLSHMHTHKCGLIIFVLGPPFNRRRMCLVSLYHKMLVLYSCAQTPCKLWCYRMKMCLWVPCASLEDATPVRHHGSDCDLIVYLFIFPALSCVACIPDLWNTVFFFSVLLDTGNRIGSH